MHKLLQDISKLELKKDTPNESLSKISESIKLYYNANQNRHSYYDVSNFVYEMNENDYEYIISNLDVIKNYFESVEAQSKYAMNIGKLKDHIQLEVRRIEYIESVYMQNTIQKINSAIGPMKSKIDSEKTEINDMFEKQKESIENVNKEFEKQKESIKNVNEEFEKQKKAIEGINTQIVSVLSIFGAIIVAFIGGLSALSSIFATLGSIHIYKLLFTVSVIGFIMFNLIYMLLHTISKIIGKDIGSKCRIGSDCDKCSYRKNANFRVICIEEKYPIIFWFNLVSSILIIVTLLSAIQYEYHVFNNLWDNIIDMYSKYHNIFLISIIVLFIIIFNGIYLIMGRVIKVNNTKVSELFKLSNISKASETLVTSDEGDIDSDVVAISDWKVILLFKSRMKCIKEQYMVAYVVNKTCIIIIIILLGQIVSKR